jgi:hypothetical protein
MSRTVVLSVSFDRSSGQYRHVQANVAVYDDGRDDPESSVRSAPSTAYDDDTPFHRVHVYSQTDQDHLSRHESSRPIDRLYGVRTTWDCGRADLSDLENGVKALRRVESHLRKADDIGGPPATIGEYIRRVAKSLGIKLVYVPRDQPVKNPYADLDYAADLIDRKVAEWVAQANGVNLTAVA